METGDGFGLLLGIGAAILVLARLWPRMRVALGRAGRSRPSAPKPAAAMPPAPFSGKAYVIDGDTIEVTRIRVRLHGMDAPEMSQAGGRRARAHMIRLAAGREVRVLPVARDVYGRTVARVMLGTTDLSERMVLDGFAIATRRWCRDYVEAEEMARNSRQGLWLRDTIGGISDPAVHRRNAAGTAVSTYSPERPERGRDEMRGKRRGVVTAFAPGKQRR